MSRTWHVLMFIAACFFTSVCVAGEKSNHMQGLQGRWILESVDGRTVDSEPEIYFEIDGSRITGFDGCNSFGGSLDDPPELRASQRACASEGPRLPLNLSDPRPQLRDANVRGGRLTLPLPDGRGDAVFRRG